MIKEAWKALKAGEELTDSAKWKDRQNTANAVAAVLGLVVVILPKIGVGIEISTDDTLAIAGGIAAILGVCNGYLTTATSKKVGLQARGDDQTAAG